MARFALDALPLQPYPAMFHTATVRPKRLEPGLLYNTSLNTLVAFVHFVQDNNRFSRIYTVQQ